MRNLLHSRSASPAALLRDERGNFTMLFALSGAAMILTLGLGIDYYVGVSTKARLDAAADAAALDAVNAAKAYYVANSKTLPPTTLVANSIAAGQSAGLNAFNANVSTTRWTAQPGYPALSWGSFTNMTFTASLSYQGNVPTFFGGLDSISNFGLSGTATAQSQIPQYMSFYILADVSGSMGIPTEDINPSTGNTYEYDFYYNNPDNNTNNWFFNNYGNCQFACHFTPNNGVGTSYQYQGFQYTRDHGIALKLDSVGNAINNLLSTAQSKREVPNQYQVGVYTFIDTAIAAAAMSTDISNTGTVATVAKNLANYLDQGTSNSGMGAGGTHLSSLWSSFSPFLQTLGDGTTQASPKPIIVLVTDGIDNTQWFSNGWYGGGSHPVMPDTSSTSSLCTQAKNLNYTVAVLLVPYKAILNPSTTGFSNNEDQVVNYYVNPTSYSSVPWNAQTLSSGQTVVTNMQSCASTGYFFSASTTADINNAMQAIFNKFANQTLLTQ